MTAPILKSINIIEDFAHPDRVCHFWPTSKSIDILRSVVGPDTSRATTIIAPYGSGKSIAATIGSLLVEGNGEKLAEMEEVCVKLNQIDPAISDIISHRSTSGTHGAVVLLSSYISDLPGAIAQQLALEPIDSMHALFRSIETMLRQNTFDRIAIVWDEFGRHLESLVSKGRAEDLAMVQDLAEWTIRRQSPLVTLTLLMHQEFLQYSGRLGVMEQTAWKKIEGRFETLRILEDSDEIYGFIANIVNDLNPKRQENTSETVAKTHQLGLFPFLQVIGSVHDLLMRASPLTPAALFLLPKIAGRVGQNERTVFGFLSAALSRENRHLISPEDIYQYFSDSMRMDTGVGGCHRKFVETESARSRAATALEREVLAATSLLHLAVSGSEFRVSLEKLLLFLEVGVMAERSTLKTAIENLLDRKLLLHRKLSDEISVWQGADVNIRARVKEEMDALRNQSDTVSRIAEFVPQPVYLAPRYNHNNCLTRYAVGKFVTLSSLQDDKQRSELLKQADQCDALVALVIDASSKDYQRIRGKWLLGKPHLILAFAKRRPDLDQVCLEAAALNRLEKDDVLLEMDPLIEREVQELKSDTLDYIFSRSSSLIDPEVGDVFWYSNDNCLNNKEIIGGGGGVYAPEKFCLNFSQGGSKKPLSSQRNNFLKKGLRNIQKARKEGDCVF